jgi:hypothetical protein
MILHALDCPFATGELQVCTCGAVARFALRGDGRPVPRAEGPTGRPPPPLFLQWRDDEQDDGWSKERC